MSLNENVELSLKDGMRFTFSDEGKVIIYKVGSFSGKEIVTLNGEVVSEQKSYGKNSIHKFVHEGKSYQIQLVANNIVKGDADCNFSVNDQLVTSYKLNYVKKQKHKTANLLVILLGGGLIGFAWSAELVPTWVLVIFLGLMPIWGAFNSKGHWVCHEVSV